MKTIFKHIEGREWDWFGHEAKPETKYSRYELEHTVEENGIYIVVNEYSKGHGSCCDETHSDGMYSLAELLANKSWCKAVWGEEIVDYKVENSLVSSCHLWQRTSTKAFTILQQEGEDACIEYIKKTMV